MTMSITVTWETILIKWEDDGNYTGYCVCVGGVEVEFVSCFVCVCVRVFVSSVSSVFGGDEKRRRCSEKVMFRPLCRAFKG